MSIVVTYQVTCDRCGVKLTMNAPPTNAYFINADEWGNVIYADLCVECSRKLMDRRAGLPEGRLSVPDFLPPGRGIKYPHTSRRGEPEIPTATVG
jgi:hypothetical protein